MRSNLFDISDSGVPFPSCSNFQFRSVERCSERSARSLSSGRESERGFERGSTSPIEGLIQSTQGEKTYMESEESRSMTSERDSLVSQEISFRSENESYFQRSERVSEKDSNCSADENEPLLSQKESLAKTESIPFLEKIENGVRDLEAQNEANRDQTEVVGEQNEESTRSTEESREKDMHMLKQLMSNKKQLNVIINEPTQDENNNSNNSPSPTELSLEALKEALIEKQQRSSIPKEPTTPKQKAVNNWHKLKLTGSPGVEQVSKAATITKTMANLLISREYITLFIVIASRATQTCAYSRSWEVVYWYHVGKSFKSLSKIILCILGRLHIDDNA